MHRLGRTDTFERHIYDSDVCTLAATTRVPRASRSRRGTRVIPICDSGILTCIHAQAGARVFARVLANGLVPAVEGSAGEGDIESTVPFCSPRIRTV